jgi:antitoxin ParD1/3/4
MALKNVIQEGIDSGIVHDFDPKKHIESLKVKTNVNERQ